MPLDSKPIRADAPRKGKKTLIAGSRPKKKAVSRRHKDNL
jgi:hypothetical protein